MERRERIFWIVVCLFSLLCGIAGGFMLPSQPHPIPVSRYSFTMASGYGWTSILAYDAATGQCFAFDKASATWVAFPALPTRSE